MKKQIIPVFFTIDEGYAPYLSIAVASLIENASKDSEYHIHIIYENITLETMEKLKKLETEYAKIILEEMKTGLESITNRKENLLRTDFFTLTIYYRIFIPFMFPEYDKAIYIDSDTCIPGDISKLYNIPLKDNLFAGCIDISCKDNPVLCNYFKMNSGVSIDEYINSGVLLMNMKELRRINFEKHFLYLLNKYHFDTVCPDQDYINAMAYKKILHLSNEWNAMPTNGAYKIENPSIIHYNLFFKPWHYNSIDYEEYFWKYVEKSLFKEEIIKEKENFTKEMQANDQKTLDNLVARAEEIAHSDKTFKNVFEHTDEKRLEDNL